MSDFYKKNISGCLSTYIKTYQFYSVLLLGCHTLNISIGMMSS